MSHSGKSARFKADPAAAAQPATPSSFDVPISVPIVSRTLLAAGFTLTGAQRHPTHIEVMCERLDLLGATVSYLVAVYDGAVPSASDLPNVSRTAHRQGRILVRVAAGVGDGWLSWPEFLTALGGAVPSWRALGPDYAAVLGTVGKMALPTGMQGEAWEIFEEAVADGLEFIFGRRVRRMGGTRRGQRVSDIVAQTPDGRLIVVDAKASAKAYDVAWPQLRPLVEYVKAQKKRQQGQLEVGGAVIVADKFKQSGRQLLELSSEFFAETAVPLTFISSKALLALVERMTDRPDLRVALAWAKLVSRSGQLSEAHIAKEIAAADHERVGRETRPRR